MNAYILGEHGDSQVPVWSAANIGGVPIDEYAAQVGVNLDKAAISKRTKEGGAEVIQMKGATFYGIAMAVSNIVERIMKDESAILPVAHVLGEEFGSWAGVAISMPCIVSWDGVEKTLELPMTEKEKEAMELSVKTLKEFQENVIV